MKFCKHVNINDTSLHKSIRAGEIRFGGNIQLRIYGKLSCISGKKIKKANRIFFCTEIVAKQKGYRPCGHCMHSKYIKWKNEVI